MNMITNYEKVLNFQLNLLVFVFLIDSFYMCFRRLLQQLSLIKFAMTINVILLNLLKDYQTVDSVTSTK